MAKAEDLDTEIDDLDDAVIVLNDDQRKYLKSFVTSIQATVLEEREVQKQMDVIKEDRKSEIDGCSEMTGLPKKLVRKLAKYVIDNEKISEEMREFELVDELFRHATQ